MKKLQITLFLLVLFNLFNCNGQDKEQKLNTSKNITNKVNTTGVEEILKNQIKAGASGLYNETADGETYNYQSKDLEASIFILKKKLDSLGFKFLDNNSFNQKIKIIFGRVINSHSNSKYLYLSPVEKCEKEISFNRNKYTSSANIPSYYIIKNDNFITDLYAIPELIDYQKEYPEIAKIEDTINTNIIKDGVEVKLYLWKNEENLADRRRFNQQLLISRNKYLFNDDKSQFSWLINNDENFMRSLVTTYGYTEDKKLLEWVLENTKLPRFYKEANYESLKELSKLLWTKECNGNIRVHQNTLELIKELSTPDKDLYIMYIAEYVCNYMVSFPFKEEELTFEQKAKVMAYLLYFGEQYKYDKHYDYNQMFMTNFYNYNYQIDSYEKEFIKNNYYGLPKFKEWYEAAKKEKDYFEGRTDMEDDPHPIDYKHLSNPIK